MEPPRTLPIVLFGFSMGLLLVMLGIILFSDSQHDNHAGIGLFLLFGGLTWTTISIYLGSGGILVSIYWFIKDRSCKKITAVSLVLNTVLVAISIYIFKFLTVS